jgi:hypothetical protein
MIFEKLSREIKTLFAEVCAFSRFSPRIGLKLEREKYMDYDSTIKED